MRFKERLVAGSVVMFFAAVFAGFVVDDAFGATHGVWPAMVAVFAVGTPVGLVVIEWARRAEQ